MAISDKGSGGGRPTKSKPPTKQQKKIANHFLSNLRPAKKDTSSYKTDVTKRYKPLPGNRDNATGSKRTAPSSSGTSASANRAPVGTSGGRTSAVGHNPKTGKPGRKGGGGGGRSGGGGGGNHGGYAPGTKGLRKQAENYIQNDIQRMVKQLKQEKRDRKKDLDYDINQFEELYNRSKGDLNHVFGEANEQNALQTKAMLDRILGAQSNTNVLFDALGQNQQAATQGNQDALMAELNRLGVGAGADLGQFNADAGFARNMAEQGRTNTLANLGMMGQSASDIGSLIGQTANSSLAANIGRQLNLKNDNISQARHDYRGDADEIFNAIRAERQAKGNRVFDMWQSLDDKYYDRWFQNREANRANKLGWSNFNQGVSMDNANLMFQKAAMLQEQRAAAAEARRNRRDARNYGQPGGGGGGTPYNPMLDIFGG